MKRALLLLCIFITLFELWSEYTGNRLLMAFTKPVLLPVLAWYFHNAYKNHKAFTYRSMMAAFLFSWMGDVSLMLTPETITDTHFLFIPKSKYLFLAGLGSFLLAQVCFILTYRHEVKSGSRKKTLPWLWFAPLYIYWIMMVYTLAPAVYHNPEKSAAAIPVIIYAAVLIGMCASALNRYGYVSQLSFMLVFTGACIFVLSDSLIAFNYLVYPQPMPMAGVWIFGTYALAEILMAEGVLQNQ